MRAFPLSEQQRALWLLMQLIPQPQQCALNLCFQIGLRGSVDEAALAEAVTRLGQRHAALRTRIWAEDGDLVQAAAAEGPILETLDLRARDDPHAAATVRAQAEAGRAMDLVAGPAARFTLLRTADAEYRLVVNVHHLVADGRSVEVLASDLAGLYTSVVTGRPPAPPSLLRVGTYEEFVEAQAGCRRTGALDRAAAYWTAQLAGTLPTLDLRPAADLPALRSFRGGHLTLTIHRGVMEACRKASFRLRVPLSAFLLSAFVRVLAGRTGQPRMIIGTHFGGRTAERWRDAVGLYTNTVPIVLDVDPAASEPEIVQHVNAQYLGAYEHQDYPLQWLLERVPVPRSLNRPVLFQIVFSYQSAQSGAAADAWAGATETSFDLIETPTSTFELQLHVTSASSGTVARFDYSTDLFAREFVAGLAGEFVNVVERSSSPTYAHA